MKTKIREKREELGLTQEELAVNSGVARRVISELEVGKREVITSETMIKIAKALHSDVKSIFLF